MLDVCQSAFECGVCTHGTADPAKDESVFDKLRERAWREHYDVQGDFNDGHQYLFEVCTNGHMLCEECYVAWEQTHNKCPFCRAYLIPSEVARKMEVFHTNEIAEQHARNDIFGGTLGSLSRIAPTLLRGVLPVEMYHSDGMSWGFWSFVPLCIRPIPYESTARYLLEIAEPNMTVARMMQRMQMYDDLPPSEFLDAVFWKLCVVCQQPVHGIMESRYKAIDSNLRMVDFPEFVFDYGGRNLVIFTDIDAGDRPDVIIPGVADLEEVVRLAHINNQINKANTIADSAGVR